MGRGRVALWRGTCLVSGMAVGKNTEIRQSHHGRCLPSAPCMLSKAKATRLWHLTLHTTCQVGGVIEPFYR